MFHLALVWACTGEETDDTTPPDPTDLVTTPTGSTGGSTGDTSGTTDTDTEPNPACIGSPPSGTVQWMSTPSIRTEEDFDFDGLGFLITQSGSNLAGIDRQGGEHIVSAGIGADAAGLRSVITGDIIVAQPDTGSLRRVDYATGGSVVILGGLNFPNGLVAGLDGMVYVTEWSSSGGVRMVDPYTGDFEILDDLTYPNGIALSPDDQTLYVAVGTSQFSGSGRILAYERDDDGDWEHNSREVFATTTLIDGLTTDACGHLYGLEYSTGRVFRLNADDDGYVDGDDVDGLAELGGGSWSSARFGHGRGGWELDELYVTNRQELFILEVGVDGWHVLQE